VFALACIGCSGDKTSVAAENGFRFFNPKLQMTFVSALEKEHIQFRKLEDGTVIYGVADEEKVKRIRNAVLESSFTPSYRFEDEKLQMRFVGQLRSQGVNFAIEIREGKNWITWSQRDDAKVRRIREQILDSRNERKEGA
jgi:hypothetical protein